ncbi:hypothetical protein BD413DRAFT_602137 [Trametes elegans]|nr:hypothetical protein BD413DRAFT_602137 [Trametes elegans]
MSATSAEAAALAAAAAASLPPPPAGLNYVAAIQPSLVLLLIGTVWSSFLIPIAIALFFFSTPTTRRQPVFIMNVIAILLGITEGTINVYNQTRAILGKPVSPDIDTAFAFMNILVPMFAELILVFRVVTVYPVQALSWRGRFVVYAPIITFKVARVINDAIFIAKWVQLKKHTLNPLVTGQEAWMLPNAKIEWFLQFVDTIYTSALFLSRLRQSTGPKRTAGPGVASSETVVQRGSSECILVHRHLPRLTFHHSGSLSSRLRTLFWIAVSNFVIPVLLNLTQLIFTFHDSSFLHGTYIFIVNNYVQIIGVLLATVWSTGTQCSSRAS